MDINISINIDDFNLCSLANYIIHMSIFNINLRNDTYNFCISLVSKKQCLHDLHV